MKFSLNLAQYFSNVDLKAIPRERLLESITTQLGTIEEVEDYAPKYQGVVVVKVVECEKHPNADKLNICIIDDGGVTQNVERNERGLVQVVCGAPNVRQGLIVAWIPPGAAVPSDQNFVLEARELRGVVSNGMLGSPRELGVSEEHGGILEIEASDVGEELARPGTAFVKLYGLDDFVVTCENKMFTHRPDCFGNLGIAREVAAINGLGFKSPEWYLEQSHESGVMSQGTIKLQVSNESTDLVPRFMVVAMENVKISPSPVWMQAFLTRVGIRPINNVVDVTNYVMHLTGQPLHAFDYEKIKQVSSQPGIMPRLSQKAEKLALLNGKEIELTGEEIVIATDQKAVALAGIMGGVETEVDENTRSIIIECANFDMYSIRRTSMRHGLFTDAVTRFNKGQSPLQNSHVLPYVVELMHELSGAELASEIYDVPAMNSENPKQVSVEASFVSSRLGREFSAQEIAELLTNAEFSVNSEAERVNVNVPFWRMDIEIPEDIVEEVGRLYGFNRLPSSLPFRPAKPVSQDGYLKLKAKIRHILARAGANEILSYSFVHGNLLKKAGQKPEDSFAIRNALSPDLQYYRQTLTPSLLEKAHPNIKAGNDEFAIYELNKTHNKVHGNDEQGLPGELNMLALVFASKVGKAAEGYYEARKYLEYLSEQLGFSLNFKKAEKMDFPVTRPFDLERSALVSIKETGDFLGMIGEYRSDVAASFKLPACSAGFEIGPEVFIEAASKSKRKIYKPLGKYPSTEQDLTLRLSASTEYAETEAKIEEALSATGYVWSMSLVSVFQKEGDESKNFTFRFTLSHPDRTLTTEEVNKLLDEITLAAQAERA